jgi:hypothetical protein
MSTWLETFSLSTPTAPFHEYHVARLIRERLEGQGFDVRHALPRSIESDNGQIEPEAQAPKSGSGPVAAGESAPAVTPSGVIPPRPRKKQRKR